jgi:Fe-S-cluster containining protein
MTSEQTNKRQENFIDVCTGCKARYACCLGTRPPVTPSRRRKIEKYLEDHQFPEAGYFVVEDYVFPEEEDDGYCIFHDLKTKRCLIHAVKPETCVAGPITFDLNKQTGRIEWFLKKEEICPLAGAVFQDRELLSKHLVSAKREILKLVHDLDPTALKAILRKDEPETFKIDEENVGTDVTDKL